MNQNIFKEVVRTRGQVKLAIRVFDDGEYDDASMTPNATRPPARSTWPPLAGDDLPGWQLLADAADDSTITVTALGPSRACSPIGWPAL